MIERKDIVGEYEQTGSIRAVSRNLGIHRKTVQNYVKEYLTAKAHKCQSSKEKAVSHND